jgi:REP element-mobilizing transposase RayT
MVRKKGYPTIRAKPWGNTLWSPSYFAGSCGGAPISIIRQYIERQRKPDFDCFAVFTLHHRPEERCLAQKSG